MDSNDNNMKPVPQPRRTKCNDDESHNRTTYENVSINMMNKNININDDNLQTNRKVKIQNDKTFLLASSTTTTTPNRLINNSTAQSSSSADTASSSFTASSSSSISASNRLDRIEKNNLLDANKNVSVKNFEQSHKLNNLPVPAPRRADAQQQQQHLDEIYENNEEVQAPPPLRKAPQIPKAPSPRVAKMNNETSASLPPSSSSKLQSHEKLTKSLSNTSLNSSNSAHSNDTSTSSPKYKTTSPG